MGRRKKRIKLLKLSIIVKTYENVNIPTAMSLQAHCGVLPLTGLIKRIELDFHFSFSEISLFSPIQLSHPSDAI